MKSCCLYKNKKNRFNFKPIFIMVLKVFDCRDIMRVSWFLRGTYEERKEERIFEKSDYWDRGIFTYFWCRVLGVGYNGALCNKNDKTK